MAPKAITKRAKASKLAKVLAARIKAANIKISNSNTRVEPKQSGKGKSGKKRKAGDSTLNEASSRKRPSREESSQPRDDEEHDEALEAEIMHNLTGGLKLLKRETVTMGWLTSSIIRGKKIYVKFSKAGDPCDKEYGWLQSYVGVLARSRIPISYSTWKHVPEDDKEKLWECVLKIFVYPKRKKKEIISSAGVKWRNFKSILTSKYIMPHKNDLATLENVPDDYRFIDKDTWQAFVEQRLSEAHLEIRQKQILRRRKNKYNHRISRKGYRGVRIEMTAKMSTEEICSVSRHAFWIKARQDKQGNYKDAAVEEAVTKILDLEKQAAEGLFKPHGSHDVLTEALGNPEHRGRVRGIGAVKPEAFFNIPQGKRGRKKKCEEFKDLISKERKKWEEEMTKKHDEDMRRMQEKYEDFI
ncbi:hypothetical protein M5689_007242 [Euphorbia peplus]|nr:hypothetical protein M5689_007242 [Euphorbia peplus]